MKRVVVEVADLSRFGAKETDTLRSKRNLDGRQGHVETSGVTAPARIRDLSATDLHAIIANDLYTVRARIALSRPLVIIPCKNG